MAMNSGWLEPDSRLLCHTHTFLEDPEQQQQAPISKVSLATHLSQGSLQNVAHLGEMKEARTEGCGGEEGISAAFL